VTLIFFFKFIYLFWRDWAEDTKLCLILAVGRNSRSGGRGRVKFAPADTCCERL